MADILIRNMEVPSGCLSCFAREGCAFYGRHDLLTRYNDYAHKRCDDCPLVELPQHGDLIPYLAVKKAIVNYFGKDNTEWCDLMDEIDKIYVVVEGSRGSDN